MSKKSRKRSKYCVSTQVFVSLLALVLVLGCAVGGTIAWLTAETAPVVNTFTVGDIDITLAETTSGYKIVPGVDIAKDPKVTVLKNSEACWLFVTVTPSDDFKKLDDYLTYSVATGWTRLDNTGDADVYYREVAASAADQAFYVLAGNQVQVSSELTKATLDTLGQNASITLTFKAYAIQQEGFASAAAAWAELN